MAPNGSATTRRNILPTLQFEAGDDQHYFESGCLQSPMKLSSPSMGLCDKRLVSVKRSSGVVEAMHALVSLKSGTVYGLGCEKRRLRAKYGYLDRAVVLRRRSCGADVYELTNETVMIKSTNTKRFYREFDSRLEDPINEMATLQHLSQPGHANVVSLIECMQDSEHIYAVMPFIAKGDLIDQLNDLPSCRFSESVARRHMTGLVAALMYMKQKRVCHRDLSPENIMIEADGSCKVIDLGMCLVVPEPKSNGSATLIRRQLMRGKLSCMAPEIHREEPFDGFAVDVWALGTVLFVMTVGKRLYANPMDEGFKELMEGHGRDLIIRVAASRDVDLSPSLVDLIALMLHPDPQKRMTIESVSRHPWLVGESDEGIEYDAMLSYGE